MENFFSMLFSEICSYIRIFLFVPHLCSHVFGIFCINVLQFSLKSLDTRISNIKRKLLTRLKVDIDCYVKTNKAG